MGAATRSAKRDAEEAGLDIPGPEPHTANKFGYEQLIGTDLRSELKHRGLPLSGNKSVLIRRLVKNDFEEFNDFPENHPEVGTTTTEINDANVRTFNPHIRCVLKERILNPTTPSHMVAELQEVMSKAPTYTRLSTRKTQVMPTADIVAESSLRPSKGFPKSSNAKAIGTDIYKFMSVSELRQELGKKGMKKGGTKPQLLHRLTHGEDEPIWAQEETLAFDDQIDEDERRRTALMNPTEPIKKVVKLRTVKEPKPVKTGWYALNGDVLREECRSRDLSVTGRKQDLIDALEEDDRDRAALEAEQALPGWKERIDENAIATGEKRLDTFVPRPSGRYRGRVRKAQSERMFIINRERHFDFEGVPSEIFQMAGSKGHVYDVTIGQVSDCSCPDLRYNSAVQCKHMVYCLHIVLKVPHELACQTALLPSELKSIFLNAPITTEINFKVDQDAHPGVRKPLEGDCPICMFEFEDGESVVWCKAACGQNVHEHCFMQWKKSADNIVKCVYCRTPWINDNVTAAEAIMADAKRGANGYMNVANSAAYDIAVAGEASRYM